MKCELRKGQWTGEGGSDFREFRRQSPVSELVDG